MVLDAEDDVRRLFLCLLGRDIALMHDLNDHGAPAVGAGPRRTMSLYLGLPGEALDGGLLALPLPKELHVTIHRHLRSTLLAALLYVLEVLGDDLVQGDEPLGRGPLELEPGHALIIVAHIPGGVVTTDCADVPVLRDLGG